MNSSQQTAIDILRSIEARSIERAHDKQDEATAITTWAGLAFKVAGIRVLAPMGEVSEILNFPTVITRVPGARVWVKGVANVRGNLLPIIDLQAFLGGKSVLPGRRSRVLVINRCGVTTGLLVGDVQGMRHFTDEERISSARIEGVIGRFIQAAFENKQGIWPVLSMDRLAKDETFRMAAT